ncbi:MAG: ABC transporter permease [Myxococcota bacterium]
MKPLGFIVAAAILLPLLSLATGLDPWTLQPDLRLEAPSWAHPLGRDDLGRDMLARLILGFSVSVGVAGVSALGATALGAGLGVWAGTRRGWVDLVLSRGMELTQSIPKLPLLILVGSVDLTRFGLPVGFVTILLRLVVLFILLGWLTAFRVVRQSSLEIAARPFVEASRVLGMGEARLVFRHVLPHVAAPLRVVLAIAFSEFVLLESGLSFLGLGVPAPWPSLGQLMARGASSGGAALILAPGLATAAMLWWVGARIDPGARPSNKSGQMAVDASDRPR